MRAGSLVIVDVRGEDAAQMALVEDHEVIQTLAANRTYDTLDVCVLPSRGGMFGDGRVNDFPAIVAEDDGNVEQPKRRARYDKRVDGGDTLGLIEQEAAPGRGRRTSSSHHVLRNGS